MCGREIRRGRDTNEDRNCETVGGGIAQVFLSVKSETGSW